MIYYPGKFTIKKIYNIDYIAAMLKRLLKIKKRYRQYNKLLQNIKASGALNASYRYDPAHIIWR